MIENLMQSLKIMGLGMAGIFAVVAIFYVIIVVLGKIFPPEEDEK